MTFDGPLLADRYRLGPRLGHGAQAQTFLARDAQADGGRVVVVKQLRLDGNWKKFDLFEREIRTLKMLDHPGIPRFVDAFESDGGVQNLVMERAPGATLWAYAKKRRFSAAELEDVLRQALGILDYLHGLAPPVIHRDVKPANLVRAADGRISLVDFGGVREASRGSGGSTMIGTFGYMAPEQLHGESSPATDVYALGATIVALAGGVEPEEVPRRGLRMDLDAHLPALDRRLRGVLAAMVEPDPADRPQRAGDVLARLAGTAGGDGGRASDRARAAGAASASIVRAGPLLPAGRTAAVVDRVVDEIDELSAELPFFLRLPLRVAVFVIAVAGFFSLALARLLVVPLAFALVGAIAGDGRRAKVDAVRGELDGGLDQASAGLRALAGGRRRRRRRQLAAGGRGARP